MCFSRRIAIFQQIIKKRKKQTTVCNTKTEKDDEGNTVIQHVTIYYFESAEKAEAAWDAIKNKSESDKENDSDWTIESSGAMIWYGTSAAIKAARQLHSSKKAKHLFCWRGVFLLSFWSG